MCAEWMKTPSYAQADAYDLKLACDLKLNWLFLPNEKSIAFSSASYWKSCVIDEKYLRTIKAPEPRMLIRRVLILTLSGYTWVFYFKQHDNTELFSKIFA